MLCISTKFLTGMTVLFADNRPGDSAIFSKHAVHDLRRVRGWPSFRLETATAVFSLPEASPVEGAGEIEISDRRGIAWPIQTSAQSYEFD